MIIRRIKVMLVILFLLSACTDDDREDVSTGNESFLKATINGTEFSTSLEVLALSVSKQTLLLTADNKSGVNEYEFNWVIQNDRDNDPARLRYGFIELKDSGGDRKKNKTWTLPDNFTFEKTNETDTYLEGTFSFTADLFSQGVKDTSDQLVVIDGSFRAKKRGR